MATVAIREVFEVLTRRNPDSGHQWTEHGPTTGYLIVGPTGVCDRARTLASAQRKQAEWQDYYNRIERNPS